MDKERTGIIQQIPVLQFESTFKEVTQDFD